MKINEIENYKPKTPEQQRIDALKQRKDQAADALKRERALQKQRKAVKNMAKAQVSLAQTNK
jgi:hypothetical protein